MAKGTPAGVASSAPSLRRFLHGLPGVDQVGAQERADRLASRSVKATSKRFALDLAISMIDLTTLEGQDTPGTVRAPCAKARRPDPSDPPSTPTSLPPSPRPVTSAPTGTRAGPCGSCGLLHGAGVTCHHDRLART